MRKALAAVLVGLLALVGLGLLEEPAPGEPGDVVAMDGPEDPPTPRP